MNFPWQPNDQIGIMPDTEASFTIEPGVKDPGLSYEWMKDGGTLPEDCSGANTATLIIHHVKAEDAGFYYCCISNVFGQRSSRKAELSLCKCMSACV